MYTVLCMDVLLCDTDCIFCYLMQGSAQYVCQTVSIFSFLYHVIFFCYIVPMCAFKAFDVLRFVLNYQHDICAASIVLRLA